MKLNPYLTFPGTCEAAFTFYRSVFGGEFASLHRFGDMPGEQKMPNPEQIMHVGLPISKEHTLMGSDVPPGMGDVVEGTNVTLSIHVDTEQEAKDVFGKLTAGGKVTMELAPTFWAKQFGMCTDKFGIHWMINCE